MGKEQPPKIRIFLEDISEKKFFQGEIVARLGGKNLAYCKECSGTLL
jgi:hypothetical protein